MTLTAQTQEVPVVSGPQSLSSDFLPNTTVDSVFFGICALGCWVAGRQLGFFGFIVVLGTSLALVWPLTWSRRYFSGLEALAGGWISVVQQDALWENPDADEHLVGQPSWWWRRLLLSLVFLPHPWPYRVDELDKFGLIYTATTRSDSLVIGAGGSKIAAMSPQDQFARNQIIAEMLLQIGSYQGLSAQVGLIDRRRPSDLTMLEAMRDTSYMPDVVVPKALVLMQRTGKTADELYAQGLLTKEEMRDYRVHLLNIVEVNEELLERGDETMMAITITIKRSPQLSRAAKKKGAKPIETAQIRRQRIIQLGEMVCAELEKASVYKPRVLTKDECEDYLFSAWATIEASQYYPDREPLFTDKVQAYHPQHGIYSRHKVLVTDWTGHAVVQITKLPKMIEPNLMPQLFVLAGVQWMSRTTITETTSGTAEYYGLGWLGKLISNALSGLGLDMSGAKSERKSAELAERQVELDRQGHRERTNIYLAAAHPDPDQLEASAEELQRVITQIGGKSKRIRGRARMARYALTATTAIPAGNPR